jgi:hypothetical protein
LATIFNKSNKQLPDDSNREHKRLQRIDSADVGQPPSESLYFDWTRPLRLTLGAGTTDAHMDAQACAFVRRPEKVTRRDGLQEVPPSLGLA